MTDHCDAPGRVRIAPRHRRKLLEACRRAAPRECCGVLLGVATPRGHVVRRTVEILNAFSLPGGFVIPDHELRRARRVADAEALTILAVFHSHPWSSPMLSRSDREALLHSEWPWVVLTEDERTGRLRLTWYDVPPAAGPFERQRRADGV